MPSLYQLKPAFQDRLRPLVNYLARLGVTANQITLMALGLSFLAGGAIATYPRSHRLLWLFPMVVLLRMMLNAIDGMLAREHDLKTPLGAILNELGDVLSDACLYLPFSLIPGISSILIVPVVTLAIISEMAGVLGVITGGTRRYDGPMGKSDRAFVFSLVALLLAFGLTPGIWLDFIWIGMMVLVVWTIFNRVSNSLQDRNLNRNDLDSTAR